MIIIDFETRSMADLPSVGAHNYAMHKTTDILCLAMYDTDDDTKIVFDPFEEDMPDVWRGKLIDATFVGAVNATFDRLIYDFVGVPEYGFPILKYKQWYCLSAQLRVNALPANLEDAAKAAKVANLKDTRGKELIKLLSIPQDDGSFNNDPSLMQEMKDYCMKDVLASVDLFRACRQLTPTEHEDWLLCERMNDKGVKIDNHLAQLATQYADAEQANIAEKIVDVTDGVVTKPTQHQRIKNYVLDAIEHSDDENDHRLRNLMTVYKDGEKKYSLDKSVREAVLTSVEESGLKLYEDVEELIRLLDAASASSVAKFKKMLNLANDDDSRVRGAFIHAGASQTHRFSSKGLQLHNMRRSCFDATQTNDMVARMEQKEVIPDVMQSMSKLLRPALVPEHGHQFVVGDWSAIEARALPWLTADSNAKTKLDLFENNVDVYIEAAKNIFKRDKIDKSDRQIGKVAELSLGYGGAVGAFSAMARNYGLFLPETQVSRIVKAWRRKNMWAVRFWDDLEKAAKKVIRSKGKTSCAVGHVVYHYIPDMLNGTLICELPDGTFIQYPFARIEYTDKGDNIVALKAAIKPKATDKTRHWGEVRLWGGLMAENVTQALCAGLLRNCIRRLESMTPYLVAHVHDEIILEVPNDVVGEVTSNLQSVMETAPVWASGLPLKAEPVALNRYGNH